MAVLDFSSLAAMLTFVTGKLQAPDSDEIETLLEESKATKTTDCLGYTLGEDGHYSVSESQAGYEVVYRPYYVLAVYPLLYPTSEGYNQALYKTLKGAAGSALEYRDPAGVHDKLMRLQQAYDKSVCNIPKGFEVTFQAGLNSAKLVRL